LEFVDDSGVVSDGKLRKSKVVVPVPRRSNLRKILIISSVVFFGLVFLVLLISVILYFLTTVIKYPNIYIRGNLTGNVSATLGTIGNVQLQPDLEFGIVINV